MAHVLSVLGPRRIHLCMGNDIFSFADLLDVVHGVMEGRLKNLVRTLTKLIPNALKL